MTFIPDKVGYYILRAYAREEGSTRYFEQASADVTVQVVNPLTGVWLTPGAGPLSAGAVTFTAKPVGGASLEYRFFVQTDPTRNAVELTRGYTSDNTITANLASGAANIVVYVREQGSTATYSVRKVFKYTVAP